MMNKENNAKLKEKYRPMLDNLIDRNISCGSGWFGLIDQLLADICILDPHVAVLQVKEKFGTLRFYIELKDSSQKEKVYDLIHKAELKSATICEVCGKEAETKNEDSWSRTVCSPECKEKYRLGE